MRGNVAKTGLAANFSAKSWEQARKEVVDHPEFSRTYADWKTLEEVDDLHRALERAREALIENLRLETCQTGQSMHYSGARRAFNRVKELLSMLDQRF